MIMIQNLIYAIVIILIVSLLFFLIRNVKSIHIQRKKMKEQEEECDKVKKEVNEKWKRKSLCLRNITIKLDGFRKIISTNQCVTVLYIFLFWWRFIRMISWMKTILNQLTEWIEIYPYLSNLKTKLFPRSVQWGLAYFLYIRLNFD